MKDSSTKHWNIYYHFLYPFQQHEAAFSCHDSIHRRMFSQIVLTFCQLLTSTFIYPTLLTRQELEISFLLAKKINRPWRSEKISSRSPEKYRIINSCCIKIHAGIWCANQFVMFIISWISSSSLEIPEQKEIYLIDLSVVYLIFEREIEISLIWIYKYFRKESEQKWFESLRISSKNRSISTQ